MFFKNKISFQKALVEEKLIIKDSYIISKIFKLAEECQVKIRNIDSSGDNAFQTNSFVIKGTYKARQNFITNFIDCFFNYIENIEIK